MFKHLFSATEPLSVVVSEGDLLRFDDEPSEVTPKPEHMLIFFTPEPSVAQITDAPVVKPMLEPLQEDLDLSGLVLKYVDFFVHDLRLHLSHFSAQIHTIFINMLTSKFDEIMD